MTPVVRQGETCRGKLGPLLRAAHAAARTSIEFYVSTADRACGRAEAISGGVRPRRGSYSRLADPYAAGAKATKPLCFPGSRNGAPEDGLPTRAEAQSKPALELTKARRRPPQRSRAARGIVAAMRDGPPVLPE